ncbi:hypothetical protein AB0758_30805 [Tolypothrix bouteillei VB521301_2]|uniref:hypothetical protein n=1 Tax=Tolypothrix bouteillei TaxID=1246981 RepID=UPI0038B43B31
MSDALCYEARCSLGLALVLDALLSCLLNVDAAPDNRIKVGVEVAGTSLGLAIK